MSQLHHDPDLDEAAVPAPGSGTPLDGPREVPSGRPAVAPAEVSSTPSSRGVTPSSAASRAAAAARSARRAGVEIGARSVVGVRAVAAAARRMRPDVETSVPESHLAGPGDLAELAEQAEVTALAGLGEVAALPEVQELPEPPAEPEAPAAEALDGEALDGEAPDAEAPEAEDGPERCTVPHVVAGRGRHRAALVRRRPALVLAAVLVAGTGLGVLAGSDTEAQADTSPAVEESVSVARALGIEGTAPAPVADDAARLAELASSRATRDIEQFAAAQVQSEADQRVSAYYAALAAEAARPKAVLPVQGARLTSTFGARWGTLHAGIDLAAPMDTPEYAAADGVVLEAGPASGFGLAVYIQHDNGDVTVYGHMDQILVQPGQVVRAGDTIALLGNRGQSTGPHLHFEVHQGGLDGTRIDPLPWLRERGVQI
ncbi:M23 family metallopeptidase [Blastococcus sp. URHD0036]|uniref:M23 family metallopeptidase n=1 Tax=Blastococcus sp. URHD0036 TaxID=1380356 RepID=UPI001E47CB70|nr:M23 family metallopeptidase [Blastococcus sp. URHD0036]